MCCTDILLKTHYNEVHHLKVSQNCRSSDWGENDSDIDSSDCRIGEYNVKIFKILFNLQKLL
jgi:hypothetical protein